MALTAARRHGLAVAALAVLAFAPSIRDGDIALDTPWLVFDNPVLAAGWSALPRILFGFDTPTRLQLGAEYLPVRDLAVLLDLTVFGRWWAGHHLSQLAWYAAGCVGFLRVARVLLPGRAALAAALLYAALPVHAENVAWLAGKKDVVSLAFFWPAVLAGLRGRGLACAAWTLLAVWAKNTAVVAPVAAGALGWLALGQPLPAVLRTMAAPLAVALATTALSSKLGAQMGMFAAPRAHGPLEFVVLQGRITAHDLRAVVAPWTLSVRYPEPQLRPLVSAANAVGVATWTAMLAAIPALRRRAPTAAAGIALWFVALLPVSQLAPIQNLLADRYLLLPSAGLLLALAAVPRAAPALLALSVLAVPAAWLRCAAFASTEAIWSDALAQHPALHEARAALAAELATRDRAAAEALVEQGLRADPDAAPLRALAGRFALERGDAVAAEALLRGAPGDAKAELHLAQALQRQGRLGEALEVAAGALAHNDLYAHGWNTFGALLLAARRPVEAEQAFRQAVALDPGDATALCNLPSALWNQGRRPEAGAAARACLQRVPDHAMAAELARRAAGP